MGSEYASEHVNHLVLGITPLETPDARLASAICQSGTTGVLDLGSDRRAAKKALDDLRHNTRSPFGVRIGSGSSPSSLADLCDDLPPETLIVLSAETNASPTRFDRFATMREVRSVDEALQAQKDGAIGLIARGDESGGYGSSLSTFILLQALISTPEISIPIWACGGIGLRTAAAALAMGATGIVLDIQLALLDESHASLEVRHVLDRVDGSETTKESGYRFIRQKHTTAEAPLVAGQDAYLAKIFAKRFKTVSRTIAAFRNIPGRLATSTSRVPSTLCETLGTPLPLLQGPMTRVSDQPGFAVAVADAGALPFVALALLDGSASMALLRQCQEKFADRPWGVGILGFADDSVRQAQWEAIAQARPTHAIIAGGRPSQVVALEELGITSFLHAPSPTLLEQFLEAGVRRFIFEGAECGGHIGPRNSFPLWEAQLDVVKTYLEKTSGKNAPPIELVFAGGIHDAVSAAAAMALTIDLPADRVRTGLLMGTAYLFTVEAVKYGAIGEVFQQQLVEATQTSLLETAPGHATRCLSTPFVPEFHRHKQALRAQGASEREVWQALEQFNLGRLRLASKGLLRRSGALEVADSCSQLADGMFMAGDVSILQDQTSTLHRLHTQVTKDAADHLLQRAEQFLAHRNKQDNIPERYDVAIIGLACTFSGAEDISAFWRCMLEAKASFSDVPSTRWNADRYQGDQAVTEDTVASRRGAFLTPVKFNALRYGIPPSSMANIEPIQLLSLEMAQRALDHAGYGQGGFDRTRTAVIFGAEAGSELRDALTLRAALPTYADAIPPTLLEQLPKFTEDTFPGTLSNVIAGRIASRLDLGGGNFTIDAACASSIAALDAACKELRRHGSDLVLCGGADLHNGISDYMMFNSAGALSPSGRSLPFDANSDGIVLGEGVACLVLKRLEDAQRDGDRIYSVIEAVGSASDGRARGLTAPRVEGQCAALRRAYEQARRSPAAVRLIEAHGTGTVVGDQTELTALSQILEEAEATKESCSLGSAKALIGHTKCAAGMAGIIKATLALHTGIRPPTAHIATPNAAWPNQGPLRLQSVPQPWPASEELRIAGVSAFGFGGTNFHTVLSSAGNQNDIDPALIQRPCELILIRGETREAAEEIATRYLEKIESATPMSLLALTVEIYTQTDRRQPVQFSLVAKSVPHLAKLLRSALEGIPIAGELNIRDPDHSDIGKLAFLFPGQGSQRPNMLSELPTYIPSLRKFLALDKEIEERWFTSTPFDDSSRNDQVERLKDTRVAQPALGMASMMATEALECLGIVPDMSAGHSYGELVALCVAGAYDTKTLLKLSKRRAACIFDSLGDDPGSMAAINASPEAILPWLAMCEGASDVVCANHNAPEQTVISGTTEAISSACAFLKQKGIGARPLPVACAFHSPIVAGASAPFRNVLADLSLSELNHQVWSNRLATPYEMDASNIAQELAEQIACPVRFVEQIRAMHDAGARIFLEVGPGHVLCGLTRAILGERPHRALSIDPQADGTLAGLMQTLASLAVMGVAIDESWLVEGRNHSLREASREPESFWLVDGHYVRSPDGMPLTDGIKPALPVATCVTPAPSYQDQPNDYALVEQFIQSASHAIASQRDVLLQHLGGRPGHSSPPLPASSDCAPPAAKPTPSTTASPLELHERSASSHSVESIVTHIISERTGYPANALQNHLDLESDLSIDSIKRAEIIGHIVQSMDEKKWLSKNDPATLEALSQARTINAICDVIKLNADDTTLTVQIAPSMPDVLQAVISAICDRTGYPPHAITKDMDLESELSVDSIKRAEIAGYLAQAFVVANHPETIEALSASRTPAAMAAVLAQNKTATEQSPPVATDDGPMGTAPRRFVESMEPTPLINADDSIRNRNIRLVTRSAVLTEAVRQLVDQAGLSLDTTASFDAGASFPFDLAVDVASLTEDQLPAQYTEWKAFFLSGHRRLFALYRKDDDVHRAGLRGLFRCAAKEFPDQVIRLIELEPNVDAKQAAKILLAEATDDTCTPIVCYRQATRYKPTLVDEPVTLTPNQPIPEEATWVLIGGARGITAQLAQRLAASANHIALIGRTKEASNEFDCRLEKFHSLNEIRGAMLEHGMADTAALATSMARDLLARREIQRTMLSIAEAGCGASYHPADIADASQIDALLQQIEQHHGRIYGIVHAAGVIEDKLIADKDERSFARVWAAKVEGAKNLMAACEKLVHPPTALWMFGSIAALAGNRGQSDYAAANSAMDALGRSWSKGSATRAITMHWGPWAPLGEGRGGMVSTELGRQFAARDIPMIRTSAGVDAFIAELTSNRGDQPSVVYSAGTW